MADNQNNSSGFIGAAQATILNSPEMQDYLSVTSDFKLDTKNFNSMYAQYGKQVDVFEELKKRVSSTLDEVSDGWEGKGKKAFEKQAKNIRKNLADLMDIIIETREVLLKAGVNYTDVDSGIGKQMETNK